MWVSSSLLLGGSEAQSGDMSCPRSELINGRAKPTIRTLNSGVLVFLYVSPLLSRGKEGRGRLQWVATTFYSRVPLCLTILVFPLVNLCLGLELAVETLQEKNGSAVSTSRYTQAHVLTQSLVWVGKDGQHWTAGWGQAEERMGWECFQCVLGNS